MNNNKHSLKEDIINENASNQEFTNKEESLIAEKNELQKEIDALKILLEEQSRSQSYLKADIENIKRNNKREIDYSVNREMQKTIASFLLVLDDYERSLLYIKTLDTQNLKEVIEGLTITYNAFLKALRDIGITEVKTDTAFNPEYHEAISVVPDPSKPSDSIVSVAQKGYLYKDKLIRSAKVIIAK